MSKALQTVEQGNLYASFGLIEDLSEDEMMDIDGGKASLVPGPGGQPCINVSIPIGSSGGASSSSHSSSSHSSTSSWSGHSGC